VAQVKKRYILEKQTIIKADGRRLIYYFFREQPKQQGGKPACRR